jgi:uncharacterized protein YndB with AHSA1/START domain
MDKLAVIRSIWIAAPREKVWQAITDPDQVMQWFVPNLPGAQMKRDDSGTMTIYMGPMGIDFVQVEMANSPRQVISRSLPERLLMTTYTLDDENNGTRVTVSMSGFEELPENTREDRLALMGAGWEKALQNLKAFVNGANLPFPQAYVGPLFGYWREPEQKLAIERSIWIDGSREKVWRAITDPVQLQKWLSPETKWYVSALEVGGRFYTLNADTNAEQYVEHIQQLDPLHQLVTQILPEPPDTAVKTKTYTLKEENGGTRLFVTLTGYAPGQDDALWSQMEQNTFGFGMMLLNAKAYIEGNPVPVPGGF